MQQGNPENYITIPIFERAMKNIASRFDAIDIRFNEIDRMFETITRELQSNRDDHERFRNTLLLHDREIVEHDRYIDGIAVRVQKLEKR